MYSFLFPLHSKAMVQLKQYVHTSIWKYKNYLAMDLMYLMNCFFQVIAVIFLIKYDSTAKLLT